MNKFLLFSFLLFGSAWCYAQEEYDFPVPNCAPAAKVDEFRFTSLDDAKERIDLYGLQIKNGNGLGIVIGYGGRNTESNEGRTIASQIAEYLTSKFKFTSYYTISPVAGGHREERSVEFFIKFHSCGSDPEASPSLGYDEVVYKEEKDFFGKVSFHQGVRNLLTNDIDPSYPAAARAVRARGKVTVLVLIDERGRVSKASAIDGHPLLRVASVNAVKLSTFQVQSIDEQPIKYGGKIEIDFDRLLDKLDPDYR